MPKLTAKTLATKLAAAFDDIIEVDDDSRQALVDAAVKLAQQFHKDNATKQVTAKKKDGDKPKRKATAWNAVTSAVGAWRKMARGEEDDTEIVGLTFTPGVHFKPNKDGEKSGAQDKYERLVADGGLDVEGTETSIKDYIAAILDANDKLDESTTAEKNNVVLASLLWGAMNEDAKKELKAAVMPTA